MSEKKTLIYDCMSAPINQGLDFDKIVRIFKEFDVVIWTSEKNGVEPKVVTKEIDEIKLIDVAELSKDELEVLLKKYE